MTAVVTVYAVFASPAEAERVARQMVEARLAACVNILAPCRSIYRWQGAVTTADEELLLLKTTAGRFEALKARLLQLHPYELPELIAVPVEFAHTAYLDWVRQTVGG